MDAASRQRSSQRSDELVSISRGDVRGRFPGHDSVCFGTRAGERVFAPLVRLRRSSHGDVHDVCAHQCRRALPVRRAGRACARHRGPHRVVHDAAALECIGLHVFSSAVSCRLWVSVAPRDVLGARERETAACVHVDFVYGGAGQRHFTNSLLVEEQLRVWSFVVKPDVPLRVRMSVVLSERSWAVRGGVAKLLGAREDHSDRRLNDCRELRAEA
mmetsp:Transcript_12100/g.32573  ORF Transcript_12100/g.32573 Transcript_12100/m.32573 type:complete len:215 (+) Transcript_12100:517-1161(+)